MFGAVTFKQLENAIGIILKNNEPYSIMLKEIELENILLGSSRILLRKKVDERNTVVITANRKYKISKITIETPNKSIEYNFNPVKHNGSANKGITVYSSEGTIKNENFSVILENEKEFEKLIEEIIN